MITVINPLLLAQKLSKAAFPKLRSDLLTVKGYSSIAQPQFSANRKKNNQRSGFDTKKGVA
jgi:hypothetical protein